MWVRFGCVLLLLSVSRSICVAFVGVIVTYRLCAFVALVSFILMAAMVGAGPTAFLSWYVGLLCSVLCLMVFCMLDISARFSVFGSVVNVSCALLFDLVKAILLLIIVLCLYWAL